MPTQFVQKGITRYDKDANLSNGYMVRVTRDGTTHGKYFSDTKFYGKRKALAAARAAYESLVKKLPPVKTTKNVKTSRNTTGVVGVHLAESVSTYGDLYEAYCASWKTEDGRRAKISFAFKKYGKAAAFRLAKIARELETSDRDLVERRYKRATGKIAGLKKARAARARAKNPRTKA
jgi:hypothetical protein